MLSPITMSEERLLYLEQRVTTQMDRFEGLLQRMECISKTMQVGQCEFLTTANSEVNFFDFMCRVIDELKRSCRMGTAESYQSAMASFKQFIGLPYIAIDHIDDVMIKQYEQYLFRRGVAKNTSSFYMRILRAVYNRAIEKKLITSSNPFKHVYTGVERTVKRAIDLETIRRIKQLDLSDNYLCELARDMFLLSFYLRGMSYVDMVHLKKTNLSKGYLSYRRRKTGQEMHIKWEKPMQELVKKYKHQCCRGYLLPLMRQPNPSRSRYKYGLTRINRQLHYVAQMVGMTSPLTLYVARHSWASIAKQKQIPLSVISEGMGHDNETTTRIYLKTLDKSVVDNANNQILKELC